MTLIVKLTDQEIEDGKDALELVLVHGQKMAKGFPENVDEWTQILAPQHPDAEINNLRSLVFKRNEDGWLAVFVLKKVRDGLPGVFTTRLDQPYQSIVELYRKVCLCIALLYNAERLGIKPSGRKPGTWCSTIDDAILTSY